MPEHKVKIECGGRGIICRCQKLLEVFPDCTQLSWPPEIGTL